MCDFNKDLRRKQFVGYKVALKRENKYYSPSMGCEYKIGDVPVVKKQKNLAKFFYSTLLKFQFHEGNVGRTGLFINITDAKLILKRLQENKVAKGYKPVLLKMTVGGKIAEGFHGFYVSGLSKEKVIGGTKILKIEEVESN